MSSKGYRKPEGTRDLKEPAKEVFTTNEDAQQAYQPAKAVPPSYSKQEGTKNPALFIIMSGGEKRERDYFSIITNNPTHFPRVKIEYNPSVPPVGYPPTELFLFAKEIKKKYDKTKGNDLKDHLYLITDVDHFINEIKRLMPQCIAEDIKLIVSNPCFEIWLYYGKVSTKPIDFKEPDLLKISSAFKTYLGNKVKGGVNPKRSLHDIEDAIKNATSNYEQDVDGVPKRYSTNMFNLAKDLLPFIKSELDKKKAETVANANQFKKA